MFTPHGTFSLAMLIPPLIILVVGLTFWGWMFREMLDNRELSPAEKENWTFLFILLNVFGAAIYYRNVYRNRR
jgi:cytochrome c oxidase assembly factor CtaG